MSTFQTAIPFKSRKRTTLENTKSKSNIENLDILNVGVHDLRKRNLKRQNQEEKSIKTIDNEICSARKIGRKNKSLIKIEGENSCNEELSTTNLKPLRSREKEIAWLEKFLLEHLENEESGSLYISGQPGTGKTASLTYILSLQKIKEGYKQVYINCTMVKSAASIYGRICKELQLPTLGTSEKACLSAIEKYLSKKHKMVLLVLDEIDQLDSKRQSVLYSIFEWAGARGSRLVLVGVANALDLAERTLPRLHARGLCPRTLHFPPYTKQQIIDIFLHMLASQDNTNVFSPVALQLLAAKIAAVSGDMRRALDIGRRVIELAKRSKFSENKSLDKIIEDTNVTVEIKQVLEVLNDVYGGSNKIENDVEDSLPMQQKLILCSLLLMLNKGKSKEIIMGKLHDVYKKVAAARNIGALEAGELAAACQLLEARGALRVRPAAGGARAWRVLLQWDEDEVRAALRDKPLIAAILAQPGRYVSAART